MTKTTNKKFTLTAAPTFEATVTIPTRNGEIADLKVTFKHRTRDEFKKFGESLRPPELKEGEVADPNAKPFVAPEDVDVLMDIASGWDLDDAFNRANVNQMVQNYMGSARAIIAAYFDELTGARVKN